MCVESSLLLDVEYCSNTHSVTSATTRRTRAHEVYRCTVHSRHQGPRGTHAQLLPSRRALLARHALCVSALGLGAARLYESRAPRIGATAATACSLPAATGARRVAVRRLLLMLLPRRAVVHPRGGTQLEGVGDRRAGSLSSADAASRLGGGSCFAARVARRRTRLRSAAAARSERAGSAGPD